MGYEKSMKELTGAIEAAVGGDDTALRNMGRDIAPGWHRVSAPGHDADWYRPEALCSADDECKAKAVYRTTLGLRAACDAHADKARVFDLTQEPFVFQVVDKGGCGEW